MAIQVRQGNEVDFDAEKMLPGEWAVSTDAKIVRMCFAQGVVARMATYEAFKEYIDAHVVGTVESLFIPITQEEYDALVAAGTVDDSKYYMIVG